MIPTGAISNNHRMIPAIYVGIYWDMHVAPWCSRFWLDLIGIQTVYIQYDSQWKVIRTNNDQHFLEPFQRLNSELFIFELNTFSGGEWHHFPCTPWAASPPGCSRRTEIGLVQEGTDQLWCGWWSKATTNHCYNYSLWRSDLPQSVETMTKAMTWPHQQIVTPRVARGVTQCYTVVVSCWQWQDTTTKHLSQKPTRNLAQHIQTNDACSHFTWIMIPTRPYQLLRGSASNRRVLQNVPTGWVRSPMNPNGSWLFATHWLHNQLIQHYPLIVNSINKNCGCTVVQG